MKTITLFAYLFLFSISIHAQVPDPNDLYPSNEFPIGKSGLQTDSAIYKVEGKDRIKIIGKYLPDGRMTEKAEYVWNEETRNWDSRTKENYEYTTSGKLILYTAQDIPKRKEEYLYDDRGNVIYYSVRSWSKDNNDWYFFYTIEEKKKYSDKNQLLTFEEFLTGWWVLREYSYNSSEKISTETIYQRQIIDGDWQYDGKKVYTYEKDKTKIDSYGRQSEIPYYTEEQIHDENNNLIWSKQYRPLDKEGNIDYSQRPSKNEYLYHDKENLKASILYYWDNAKQEWYVKEKREYIYAIKNNFVSKTMLYYDLNPLTNTLENRSFVENRYDLNGNEVYFCNGDYFEVRNFDKNNHTISKICYVGNLTNDSIKVREHEFSYDMYGNILSEVLTPYNHVPGLFRYELTEFTYYYSPLPTNIPSVSNNTITISPNPVSDVFFIDGLNNKAELFLSNMNGQIVFYQKEIENNSSVSIADLPMGIYIAKIVSGKESITKKIVKR